MHVNCQFEYQMLRGRTAYQITSNWNLFKFKLHHIPISSWFPAHNHQESDPSKHLPSTSQWYCRPISKWGNKSKRTNPGGGYCGSGPSGPAGSSVAVLSLFSPSAHSSQLRIWPRVTKFVPLQSLIRMSVVPGDLGS